MKSRTQLSDFTFTFHFHALEKEMATHSSILAWRIPGIKEPARLPSMGSHRIGHDWSDLAAVVKNPPANAEDKRDTGSIPGLGRSPGGGMAIHSSILAWRIPMDRGAWRAIVYRVAKSQTWLKRLSMQAFFWSTWNLRADSQGLKYVLCELDRGLCKKSIILLTPSGKFWAFVSSGIWPRRSAKFLLTLTFYDSFAK